jgi:hypothetical protein
LMATLPTTTPDPTIDAMLAAVEAANRLERPRPYLGMSGIGMECERRLWYQFRWCLPAGGGFDSKSLLNFADGHATEDVMAARLRTVPGVELYTIDPSTGRQFGFVSVGGHFRGHSDGMMRGVLQAPKAWHVWEHKASEKGPADLARAKDKLGEKNALASWSGTYYAQAVLYMHHAQVDRHYLTCSSPGGRLPITTVRTNAAPDVAAKLTEKAERIIYAAEPLGRLSEDPAFWTCKGCPAATICHTPKLMPANCRNCLHATPESDGDGRWSCAKWGADIPTDAQADGCEKHRYIPALLKRWGEATDASEAEGWVEYTAPDGLVFRNGPWGLTSFTSKELSNWTPSLLRDAEFAHLREKYAARYLSAAEWEEAA